MIDEIGNINSFEAKPEKHSSINRKVIYYLVVLLFFGGSFIWITAIKARRNLYNDLLRHARITSIIISQESISSLNNNISDTTKNDYKQIKHQLNQVIKTIPEARFVYLLGIRLVSIYFIADSEPIGSPDESLPGDIYSEASSILRSSFKSGNESFEGPLKDKWGNWMSIFIPVKNQINGELIAVLGLDVSVKHWIILIIKECMLPVSLMIFALYFLFVTILNKQKAIFNKIQSEKIRISEEKYRLLITNIKDIVYSVDVNTKEFAYLSPSFEKITGYSIYDINKMGGRNSFLSQVLSNEVLVDSNLTYLELVGSNESVFKQDAWWKCKDGSFKFLQDHWIHIYVNDIAVSTDGILIDITERKKVEQDLKLKNEELIRVNTDKDRFMSILAHDLKSPFNGLLGFSDLLSLNIRNYDIDKIEKYAGIINKTAKSTYNLLEDLLLWARSQSGKIPFEPQITSLFDVCEIVVDGLKLNAKTKNINIKFPTDKELLIYSDIDMLKTVLRNLISNAIKFTHNNGHIEIHAVETETHMIISVSDDGIGLSAKSKEKLFDVSGSFTTKGTENESGTGLGLLLCKEFIEKHGGELKVESQEGYGSIFCFKLPHLDKAQFI